MKVKVVGTMAFSPSGSMWFDGWAFDGEGRHYPTNEAAMLDARRTALLHIAAQAGVDLSPPPDAEPVSLEAERQAAAVIRSFTVGAEVKPAPRGVFGWFKR